MVMGHESSGWVCEVGSNSKKSLIGERVTFNPAISCVGTCGHGIENHCQQVARAEGCASVTISESMSSRRDLAASLGFDTTTPETVSELPKFDKAFDAVGIDATAAATISAIKKGGTVCFVGLGLPSISVPLFEIVVAERNIIGSFAYTDEAFERARDLILDKKLTVQELIGQDTDFEGVATAFSDLASSKRTDLKVLMSTGEHEQN